MKPGRSPGRGSANGGGREEEAGSESFFAPDDDLPRGLRSKESPFVTSSAAATAKEAGSAGGASRAGRRPRPLPRQAEDAAKDDKQDACNVGATQRSLAVQLQALPSEFGGLGRGRELIGVGLELGIVNGKIKFKIKITEIGLWSCVNPVV